MKNRSRSLQQPQPMAFLKEMNKAINALDLTLICGLIIGLGLSFSTGLGLGLVTHSHLWKGSWCTRLCMMPLLQKLRLEIIWKQRQRCPTFDKDDKDAKHIRQAAVETQQKLGNGMEAGVTQGPLINKSQHRWTLKYKNCCWWQDISSIISN